MHRSSPSIAAIASALAKAQTMLVNPEKTMTATIRDDRHGPGAERSFRYAPLSSGLDLVRKALGQQEIALVQTTALDDATRTVRLNTVLAHSSGEWIASDWPVCAMSDMNSPQRMGAALTYARRYALFTLVGIAGEDDLDAPSLEGARLAPAATEPSVAFSIVTAAPPHSENGRGGTGFLRRPPAAGPGPILAVEESARLREAMLVEIHSITSPSAATAWASTMLPAKNTLIAEDARSVESAFETKVGGLAGDPWTPDDNGVSSAGGHHAEPASTATVVEPNVRDHKLPIPRTVRHRNKEHLNFVRMQPCLICAKQPSDPHHLPFAQPRALGRKVSDEYTVPLCRAHHREVHRVAKELPWWQSRGIAPLAMAQALWQKSQSGQALNEPLEPLEKSSQKRPGRTGEGNHPALEKSPAG